MRVWIVLAVGMVQVVATGRLTGVNATATITSPTSAATYDAGSATTLTLGGTAVSDRRILTCTWVNSLGGSGTATGTTSWAITSAALTSGSNVFTVSCTNAEGTVATDVLTVTMSSGSLVCDGTTVICVTQAGAGLQNGTSAANARSMAYLNTAANWAGGGTEIDPGDSVVLSGTITSSLTLAGSGSLGGGYVTINAASATIATSSVVTSSGRSYVKFDGFRWADGLGSDAVTLSGTNDHLTITNCYAHAITSGNFLYTSGGLNTNVTVSYCDIEQATNSDASQQDILKYEGGTGFIVDGNVLTLRANSNCASCHDDIVQTYDSSGAGPPPGTLTIRYNKFVMDSTQSGNKSILQMEQTTGTNYEYGNVFYCIQGAGGANGMAHYSGTAVTWHVYNNSTYATSGSCENTWSFQNTGTLNHRNDIVSSSAGTVYVTAFGTVTRQYNNWFGTNAPSCTGTGEVCTSPLFTSQSTGDLTLTASSPGKGTGTSIANVGSETFDQGLSPSATWPNPAKLTRGGTWDMGAFCHTGCS